MRYNTLTQMKARSVDAGKYCDGQGLWLCKRNKQSGKWIVRLTINGQRREMGLGPWPDVSISEARERAATARRKVRDGIDPILERTKQRRLPKPVTLAKAIESCFTSRQAELKGDGKAGRWLSPLTNHVIPKLGTHPVEDLDQHDLRELLEPIWHEKPEAAVKALNRVNLTLKHSAALGLEVDLQAAMKARELLGKQRRQRQHIPSLDYRKAPAFYRWLCEKQTLAALALRFLILTVARTSEVRLATFNEFDGNLWTLPQKRTKNGREHRVPLTSEALEIVELARASSTNNFLFASHKGKAMSDVAMIALMKRGGYKARPHGFRATFRTWCEEQTYTPFEVKEAALGHVVDTGVIGAYQRSDRLEKRHKLLDDWQNFLLVSDCKRPM